MAEYVVVFDTVAGLSIVKQVGAAHIAAGAVLGAHIASGQIGTYHIGVAEVNWWNIAWNAIFSAAVTSGQIGTPHIAEGAVLSGHIASGQIGQRHLTQNINTSGIGFIADKLLGWKWERGRIPSISADAGGLFSGLFAGFFTSTPVLVATAIFSGLADRTTRILNITASSYVIWHMLDTDVTWLAVGG